MASLLCSMMAICSLEARSSGRSTGRTNSICRLYGSKEGIGARIANVHLKAVVCLNDRLPFLEYGYAGPRPQGVSASPKSAASYSGLISISLGPGMG